MYSLIFSCIFIVFALLSALFGMLKGRKKDWISSVSRVIIIVVSAVLAMFAAEWLSWLLGKLVYNVSVNALSSYSGISELIKSISSAPDALRALLAMAIAPAIFITLFLIIKAILNKFSDLLDKVLIKIFRRGKDNQSEKADGNSSIFGGICGAVCGFLILVVILIPAVGSITLVGGTAEVVAGYYDKDSDNIVVDVSHGISHNAGTFTVKMLGGDLIYSGLTTYPVNGELASLSKESTFISSLGNAIVTMSAPDADKADSGKAIRKAGEDFSKSTVVPMLLSDLFDAASEDWSVNEDFCGIKRPNLGDSLDGVLTSAIDILGTSDYTTIKTDVKTIFNICAVVAENDSLSGIKSKDGIISVLSNEQLTSSVILELLENERLSPLVVSITDTSITFICNKLGIPAEADIKDALNADIIVTKEKLKIPARDFSDRNAEADKLAHVFSKATDVINTVGDGDYNVSSVVRSLGPVLDAFVQTETVGREKTELLLTAILQAEEVRSKVGLSLADATAMANTINDGAKKEGYTLMMLSLGNTIDLISNASDKAHTTESVTTLMKDLTPAAAQTLQKLSTPDVIMNYGVSQESSATVSNMLSDMFGNMSSAKENGMSDEEYERESAAVSDMMSIAMSAKGNSSSKSAFGEGSVTNITATEYVERASSSTVISQTLVNSVYADGDTPTVDPMKTERNLSDDEKAELVEALDAKWKTQLASSSDETANNNYQKTLTSIASIMNVAVTFNGDAVTIA